MCSHDKLIPTLLIFTRKPTSWRDKIFLPSFICSIYRWEKWVDLQLKRFLFLVYHNHYNEHTMTSMTSRPGWWANWRPRRQVWGQTWWKTWGQDTWWKKVLVIMSDTKYRYVHCPTCSWRKNVHHTSYQQTSKIDRDLVSMLFFKILFTHCVCECFYHQIWTAEYLALRKGLLNDDKSLPRYAEEREVGLGDLVSCPTTYGQRFQNCPERTA